MATQLLHRAAVALTIVGVAASTGTAVAQATPVAKLDLNKFTGSWYEIARLPDKREENCASNGTVLYALGYKPHTFQLGTFCRLIRGDYNDWGDKGKTSKEGDGTLKISRWVFFSTRYNVTALGPEYDWALVGKPNHKALWILSRTRTMDPSLLSTVEATASAQGFDTSKLLIVPQPTDAPAAPGLNGHPGSGAPSSALQPKPAEPPSSPQTIHP